MVNSCWYIGVESRVQICKYKCFFIKIIFLITSLFLLLIIQKYVVLFTPNFPHFFAWHFWFRFPFCFNFDSNILVRTIQQKLLSVLFLTQQIVLIDNHSFKIREKFIICCSEPRVQWVRELCSRSHFISNTNVTILNNSSTHLIIHFSSWVITDPGVNTSTSWKDP